GGGPSGAGLDRKPIRSRPRRGLERVGRGAGPPFIRRAFGDAKRGLPHPGASQRCPQRQPVLGRQGALRGELRRLQQHGGDLPVGILRLMAEATAATVVPTFDDVLAARERISPYLQPTALNRYPALDELVGTETWVKHENHQPICAFKIRGGVNLMSQLSDDERRRGVGTASNGNHGQSIAYAARLFGVRAIICVPEGANAVKVSSIRGLGAETVTHGVDFDDA